MKPIRIQRSRQKKQKSPNGLEIVYCGRGSKYGNPFKLGDIVNFDWINIFDAKDRKKYIYRNPLEREDAIYLFEKYCSLEMSEFKEPNKGKNVSCWCGTADSCHADILLKLWN